jgi:hypothetical protein
MIQGKTQEASGNAALHIVGGGLEYNTGLYCTYPHTYLLIDDWG